MYDQRGYENAWMSHETTCKYVTKSSSEPLLEKSLTLASCFIYYTASNEGSEEDYPRGKNDYVDIAECSITRCKPLVGRSIS